MEPSGHPDGGTATPTHSPPTTENAAPARREVDELLEEEGSFWSSLWGAASKITKVVQQSVDDMIAPQSPVVDPHSDTAPRAQTTHSEDDLSSRGETDPNARGSSNSSVGGLFSYITQNVASIAQSEELKFVSSLASRVANETIAVLNSDISELAGGAAQGNGNSSSPAVARAARNASGDNGNASTPTASILPAASMQESARSNVDSPLASTDKDESVSVVDTGIEEREKETCFFDVDFRNLGGLELIEKFNELRSAVEDVSVPSELASVLIVRQTPSELNITDVPRGLTKGSKNVAENVVAGMQFLYDVATKMNQNTGKGAEGVPQELAALSTSLDVSSSAASVSGSVDDEFATPPESPRSDAGQQSQGAALQTVEVANKLAALAEYICQEAERLIQQRNLDASLSSEIRSILSDCLEVFGPLLVNLGL